MKNNGFSACHPIVNFIYFAMVILFSMLFMHPACLGISLVCAYIYSGMLNGAKGARLQAKIMLPLILATALLNPAFNHEGVTILMYLKNGNPLTLESIIYGIAAAAMFVTVICWFSCYNVIMTSDKFVYLFGRVIPSMSLVLSMVLRFVPKLRAQLNTISSAQKCIGRDVSNGRVIQRVKNGITILSIMVTWSMENAIQTADSMRSRGYGLPGRSSFSIFRFGSRDAKVMSIMVAAAAYIIIGVFRGGLYVRYFPSIRIQRGLHHLTLLGAYFILCVLPIAFDLREAHKWKYIQLRS